MNPIDQAFLNAYAKKKPVPAQQPSTSAEHVRPLGEQTGNKQVYAHVPKQPALPPQPHFEVATMAATLNPAPTRRSPSIVVPTGEGPTISPRSSESSALPNGSRIRIRIDQPTVKDSRVSVPHVSIPTGQAATQSVPPASGGERRTLSSYLQKSREFAETPSKISNATETIETALPLPTEKPTIAKRWSTPANPPSQDHRIDPSHERYPPVVRPESSMPWSSNGVERSTKSTASAQATAARTLNPPASKSSLPQPMSQQTSPVATQTVESVWGRIPGRKGASGSDYQETPSTEATVQTSKRKAAIDAPGPHPHVLAQTQSYASTAKDSATSNHARSPSPQRDLESVARMALPIQAIWEVDQFYWPATVANLLETQQEAFTDIGLHLQHIQSKGLRVLSVTGGERGVGRSTVAMCLAKTVATAGLRVAILDGDYECPSLVDHLNLAVDYGWQQCLSENVPLDEVVVQSIEDNVAVVPLTDSIPGSTIQDQAVRINKLIKRLSQAYDFVIIDANRLTHKNPRLLGTGVDGVLDAALVIVDAELSLRQRVDVAIDLIRQQGIQSIGIAENFHSEAKS
jgi:Mrp family chromosome partitioning ATPase